MRDRPLNVAMLLSCDTFESFFGDVLGLDRDRYLAAYRNDFSWYYARGLAENNVRPTIYIPSVRYAGLYPTDVGVAVRFLPCARWYRPLASLRRAFRATRWSLYAQEHLNAAAIVPALRAAMADDGIDVLYNQEYWGGRFDHLAARVTVPLVAQDHGGVPQGVVKWLKRRSFARAGGAAEPVGGRAPPRRALRRAARPPTQRLRHVVLPPRRRPRAPGQDDPDRRAADRQAEAHLGPDPGDRPPRA